MLIINTNKKLPNHKKICASLNTSFVLIICEFVLVVSLIWIAHRIYFTILIFVVRPLYKIRVHLQKYIYFYCACEVNQNNTTTV